MSNKQIRTRMAPSPTGFFHVGSLRTALYNFLYAKKMGGKFILRIEDTDRNRLVEGALEDIVKNLHDFGIESDEGPYWENGEIKERGVLGPYLQSKRLILYKEHCDKLVLTGHAYYCFCSPQRLEDLRKSQEAQKLPPKYDKHCLGLDKSEVTKRIESGENHVIRLNVPKDEKIIFTDIVHGEVVISSNDIDDQVLLKSDGFPTYHLAVVVDDHLMEITHVIRGEEWIPSTPKHVLLYRAFGWELPEYAHLPLLLSKSRKKLSKRDGDVAVRDFLNDGYLPEALLNFVALLGWNPKTEKEFFSLKELIEQFDLSKLNKAGAVFDLDKLDWINGNYLRKIDLNHLLSLSAPIFFELTGYNEKDSYPNEFFYKILTMEKQRLKKISEIKVRTGYFFKDPEYNPLMLIWKKTSQKTVEDNLKKLEAFFIERDQDGFVQEKLEPDLKKFIADNNLNTGQVLWPLRVALSGMEASPSPFEIIDALSVLNNGKDVVLRRLKTALDKMKL